MRLKSFYAKTMTEAMQMVRDALGEDAVIVATQEERGGQIHVTAAIEPDMGTPNFEVGPSEEDQGWLQYDEEQDENAVLEDLTEAMLRHAVPEDVMDNIISCATIVGLDNPQTALIAALEHLFTFKPLPNKAHNKAILVGGAPGSGKTLVAAKLAARGVMNGLKVGIISTDTVRAGGVEQLEAFTKILKTPLMRANSPQDLSTVLADMQGYEQVIIDTAGFNPFDKQSVAGFANYMKAGNMDPLMVLPAGLDVEESADIARTFGQMGIERILPTRLDIARRLGGLLAAAHQGQLSFTEAGNTAQVADGLTSLSPEKLARLLMPEAFRDSPGMSSSARTGRG